MNNAIIKFFRLANADPKTVEAFEEHITALLAEADACDESARTEGRFWHRICLLAARDTYRNAARDAYTAMWAMKRSKAERAA